MINDLGFFLEQGGFFQEAVEILSRVIKRFPYRMVAFLNIADAEWQSGNFKKAADSYYRYRVLMQLAGKLKRVPNRVSKRISKFNKQPVHKCQDKGLIQILYPESLNGAISGEEGDFIISLKGRFKKRLGPYVLIEAYANNKETYTEQYEYFLFKTYSKGLPRCGDLKPIAKNKNTAFFIWSGSTSMIEIGDEPWFLVLPQGRPVYFLNFHGYHRSSGTVHPWTSLYGLNKGKISELFMFTNQEFNAFYDLTNSKDFFKQLKSKDAQLMDALEYNSILKATYKSIRLIYTKAPYPELKMHIIEYSYQKGSKRIRKTKRVENYYWFNSKYNKK